MDPAHPPAKVLILNHDRDSNRAFELLLKRHGFIAECAVTSDRAMEMASRGHYRLFICRYVACKDLGIDLIGEFYKRFHIPGVLLTGTLTREQAAQFVLPEAYRGALIMPCSVEELIKTVKSALARKCPDCQGRGEILLLVSKKPCLTCRGTGWA